MSGMLDSRIGRTQGSFRPTNTQPVGRKRRADDQLVLGPGAGGPGSKEGVPWDAPHKRVLFGSDGPNSTSSGSDMQEDIPGWPPNSDYLGSTRYRQSPKDDYREETWSIKLEKAVL